MDKIFRTTAIVVMMALMSATAVFAQNTTGTNTGTTSPYHKVEVTVTIPSSIEPETVVSISADIILKHFI